MRLTFEREGGLAALPGLARPITIDTSSLSSEESAHWDRLVADADAWSLTPSAKATHADGRTYHLTLEDGPRSAKLTLCDPLPPMVRPLVRALEARLRAR